MPGGACAALAMALVMEGAGALAMALVPPLSRRLRRQPVTAGVKAGGARHGARRTFFLRLRPSENAPLPLMAKRRAVELKDR